MSATTANLQVLVEQQFACVKITGRANFNLTASFEKLLDGLHRKNIRCFTMELTDCALMDSSFLGVLVGFAVRLGETAGEATPPLIELRNPNPTVLQLFDDLGVLDLFQVAHGSPGGVEGETAATVTAGQSTKAETTRACLEAHRILMAMNEDNKRRFKDVARFLAEDLERLRGS